MPPECFPFTLLQQAGRTIPEGVREAGRLTRFAVVTRYPGVSEPVTREEYEEALSIAEEVVAWVERNLGAA